MGKQNLVLSAVEPNAIFWFAVIAMSLFFVAPLSAVTFLLKRCPAWSIGVYEPGEEETARRSRRDLAYSAQFRWMYPEPASAIHCSNIARQGRP
jgi:hypothetical protein